MIDRPIHRSSGDLSGCLGERRRTQIIELEGKQSFKALEAESAPQKPVGQSFRKADNSEIRDRD